MKRLILALTLILVGAVAYSSGIVTLEGKGYGKTEKVFMIESKGQIFSINKTDLSPAQRKVLEGLKWGAPTSITIPITSVASVRDKNP